MHSAPPKLDPPSRLSPPNQSAGIINWVVGAFAIATVVSWLQFSVSSVCCGDFDGYYHIKWSRLLWDGLRHGHLPKFTWLPLTTLSASNYADQHFLYHLLLIPFTWFSDLRLGAKFGTAAFASLAVFALYWLVLRYRVRYPMLWLAALLSCSWIFYVRLSMTRASSISILFIVAGIVLLLERKYAWLAPAAFLYVWTYNLFVLLGVLVAVWVVVAFWTERRIEWKPVLWTALGTVAGFIIHPYFPQNAKLFFEHLTSKSGAANAQAVVGSEWSSLPAWQFLDGAMVSCAAMVVGFIAFGYLLSLSPSRAPAEVRLRDRVYLQRPLLFLLFSSFLLLMTMRFVRFMEYWPPFAVLFAAFTLQEVWAARRELPDEAARVGRPAMSMPLAGLIALILVATFVYNFRQTQFTVRIATKDVDHYQAATKWMAANIPAGALIYDVNWSDFPKLFFYDTSHRYVSGLDPIYLLDVHPDLGHLNERLSRRQEQDPATAITNAFAPVEPQGVSYVFIGDYPAAPPPDWFNYMMSTGRFAMVYRDPESVILQIVAAPQPSTSAAPETPTTSATSPKEGIRHLDSPDRRKALLPRVQARFSGDIFATDEESFPGGPALVIHNSHADADWAKQLFQTDSNSISIEGLWQMGFNVYLVTDGKSNWAMKVHGNPKFRSAFANMPPPARK
jgi:hypothetical protein